MLNLTQTGLFKKLHKLAGRNPQASVYEGKLVEFFPVVEEILETIKRNFPHYTSHSVQHSLAIIYRIDQLLPVKLTSKLTSVELFLLMASALLHDSGMVILQEEEDEIDQNPEYLDFFRKNYPERLRVEQLNSDRRSHAEKLAKRHIISEFFREKHHKRSAKFIFHFGKYLDPLGPPNSRLIKCLAKICEGHGLAREQIEDDVLFPSQMDINGEQVNVKFLAACIRLGDLLDMDHERASILLMNLSNPLPFGSSVHWTRHHLDDFNVTDSEIRIGKTCSNQEEHRILMEWTTWLKKEVEHTSAMLGRDPILPFIPPTPKVSIQSDGSYIFREYRFDLNQDAIFRTLMGERLYGDRTIFLRELIQNAADALRCRAIIEYFPPHTEKLSQKTALDIPPAKRAKYAITISTGESVKDGQTYFYYEVTDNGMGMTKEVIERFFLNIGKSYYRSSGFLRNYGFRPVSYFGIGFLSNFMVSQFIEVETCPVKAPEEAILIRIQGWSNYFITEPSQMENPGTRVRVYVEPDFILSRKTGFHEESHELKLVELISRWVKHLEFPIILRENNEAPVEFRDPWPSQTPSLSALQSTFPDALHVHRIGRYLKKPSRGYIVITNRDYKKPFSEESQVGFAIQGGGETGLPTCEGIGHNLLSFIGFSHIDLRGKDTGPLTIDKRGLVPGEESSRIQRLFEKELCKCLTDAIRKKLVNMDYLDRREISHFLIDDGGPLIRKSPALAKAVRELIIFEGSVASKYGNFPLQAFKEQKNEVAIFFADDKEKRKRSRLFYDILKVKEVWLNEIDPLRSEPFSEDLPILVNPVRESSEYWNFRGSFANGLLEFKLWWIVRSLGVENIIVHPKAEKVGLLTRFNKRLGKKLSLFTKEYSNIFAVRLFNNSWLLNMNHPNTVILKDFITFNQKIPLEINRALGELLCMDFHHTWDSGGLPIFNGREPVWWYSPAGLSGVSVDRLSKGFGQFYEELKKNGVSQTNRLQKITDKDFLRWDIVTDEAIKSTT